jgi:hypothetical protein
MIRWHFSRVSLIGDFQDKGLPVLMIGNHFSWWDGFIANLINIRILHRRFHVMMLEDQLAGREFLNKAGAYSIKKGGRSAVESLRYTAELLQGDENLVVLYPQGEFQSLYTRRIKFEKGIQVIASQVNKDFHLLFYVALADYFSDKKPFLNIYLREVSRELALNAGELESAYNRFLDECILQQKEG